LTPQASGAINLAKIGREILAGAVFGETGLPDGSFSWLVGEETASSPYSMVGWIGFSCLPIAGGIADIRDAVHTIHHRWCPRARTGQHEGALQGKRNQSEM